MNTQEIKEQAHKEFDKLNIPGLYLSQQQKLKSFIDSIIDRTVQMTEERIVGVIEEYEETYEDKDLDIVEKTVLGQVLYDVKFLITNKSDINK